MRRKKSSAKIFEKSWSLNRSKFQYDHTVSTVLKSPGSENIDVNIARQPKITFTRALKESSNESKNGPSEFQMGRERFGLYRSRRNLPQIPFFLLIAFMIGKRNIMLSTERSEVFPPKVAMSPPRIPYFLPKIVQEF